MSNKKLQGKVVFRLQLDESSSEISASRKRKREVSQKAATTNTTNDGVLPDTNNVSGFLFFLTGDDADSQQPFNCYLLSTPHALLRQLSQAAAHNIPVSITRYAVVPLKDQTRGSTRLALLEVWNDGFCLLRQAPLTSLATDDFWSLSHFRRREIIEKVEMKTSRRKDLYNIVATVDAISPLIPLDPEDPFCLIELYDKNREDNTCVLVLSGHDALVWQSAIQPGETLLLEGLQRKPWQVPDAFAAKPAFQHLVGRIPSFVFVFSVSSIISWPVNSNDDNSEDFPLPLPSTPVPLVTLEGTILSMERKTSKRGSKKVKVIHRVVIECGGAVLDRKENTSRTCLLLLTHFPLASDLQLSLQCGTKIRAVNIHPIEGTIHHECGLQAYGACLRSTITLVSTSSEEQGMVVESHNSVESSREGRYLTQQGHANLCSPVDGRMIEDVVPYRLGKIKSSYRDMILKRHAEEWLDDCFDDLTMDRLDSLPSVDDLLMLGHKESIGTVTKNAVRHAKRRGFTRNPYAEFFDHAFDIDSFDRQHNTFCGCSMTQEESTHESMPSLIALNDLRMAGLRILGRRLEQIASGGSISKGWSGSIHLSIDEIALELDGYGKNISDQIMVGGFVCAATDNNEVSSVTDTICQLSIRFLETTSASNGDFVTGKVVSVVVSCFCILCPKEDGTSPTGEEFGDSINVQSLPPLGNALFDNVMGGGALIRLANHVLVASVQLRCSEERIFVHKDDTDFENPVRPDLPGVGGCSIEACLTNPREWKSKHVALKGFVMRSRFKHAKVTSNDLSNCLVITLSHMTIGEDGTVLPSFLQTIDLKVAVPHNTSKTIAFKRVLSEIVSEDMQILEDECTLAVSWWIVAESCQTSPLISGGWDEWKGIESSLNSCTAVVLSLPTYSLCTSNRGYVRWSCRLDALKAVFAHASDQRRSELVGTVPTFDFIAVGKFFDGMLCRRPARKSIALPERKKCIGVLLDTSHCDITPCSLSDIFSLACQSIRGGDPHLLSPSTVRRLIRTKFLGVAFCSAECKCNHCFQPLVGSITTGGSMRRNASDYVGEKSFWHLPAPGGLAFPKEQSRHRPENGQSSRCPPHIRNSTLRCPNKCDEEHYTVHWECSGFLDDGTGQAKLYADREAALTLLGFPEETIDKIEKALWNSRSGTIRYTKSIPPTNQLQEQVKYALSRARKRRPSPLEFLPPAARAEYLLYQHCRTSTQPSRKLDYFVRCKPLSDNVTHLNHTTVESFVSSQGGRKLKSWSEAASYSLPPIKLELIDCSVPTCRHD